MVTVPALPGCVTQAETVEEALEPARDVIELYLTEQSAAGGYLPVEPSPPTAASVEVEVPTEVGSAA